MKNGKVKFGTEVPPGFEIRGFMIRLYPDKETEAKLKHLEDDLRYLWNWLVGNNDRHLEARCRLAEREGRIPTRPTPPDYDGMEPEEAHQAKNTFRKVAAKWYLDAYAATKDHEIRPSQLLKEWMQYHDCKYDYQLLTRVLKWWYEDHDLRPAISPGAHLLRALVKNYFTKSTRRKKRRRKQDPMPIQVRSGSCFKRGDFGTRRGNPFYNCQIKINGLKIRGRLPGEAPRGRVMEGVSVTRQADGWWASIKQVVPVRVPPPAVPGTVIGIDVGLDNLAAFSNDTEAPAIPNPRGGEYAENIRRLRALGKPTSRLELRASRRVRHQIYSEVFRRVESYETIKVEKLPSDIGQRGSSKVSNMRTVVTLLKERFGDRVREVESAFTSQDCSKCGHRSKESWSYDNGSWGKCSGCGFSCHRDINAARNIAARPVKSE